MVYWLPCATKSIHFDILSEVKKAKFYSHIADEVADVGKKKLLLSLRYVSFRYARFVAARLTHC